jgi:hypothetical protein
MINVVSTGLLTTTLSAELKIEGYSNGEIMYDSLKRTTASLFPILRNEGFY